MSLFDINVMLGATQTNSEPSLRAADDLLRRMDRMEVAEALVYSSYARYSHPSEGNPKLLRQIAGHEDRLHPCWLVLPPGTSEMPPPRELVRQMRELGVRAARMLPDEFLFPVSRRVLAPLLEVLAEERIPLILDLKRGHWSEITPWDQLFDICEAFPSLPLILLRECGTLSRSLFQLWDSFPQLHIETSYMQTDSCLEEIAARFGVSRLMFGSGLPQYEDIGAVATLRASCLTPRQRADIAGNNARRLLGLPVKAEEMQGDWPVGPGRLRVWDAHAHLGPWYKISYPAHDAAATVKRMDQVGVERITISDIKSLEAEPEEGNERLIRACADFPGRIFGYGGFAPSLYGHNPAAFERLLDNPGVVGIKLHCQLHGTDPESPLYRPAYEIAHERRLPVLSHGVPRPAALRKLLEELPGMSYLAAHYGAMAPEAQEEHVAIAAEFPHFYLDATGSQMLHGAFERLLARVRPEQIVAGSDYPVMDLPYQLGRVLYSDLPDEVRHKILWENPCRIFKLR